MDHQSTRDAFIDRNWHTSNCCASMCHVGNVVQDLQPFDPDETYDIMSKQRIMAEDSDMFPFVAAKRASRGAEGRLKEFVGSKAKGMHTRKKEHETAINFGTLKAQ